MMATSPLSSLSLSLVVGEIEYLVNNTVLSFAATARTDNDRNVVGTALETLEAIFKSLKVRVQKCHPTILNFSFFQGTEFAMSTQACSSILVSLQDILHNKVTSSVCAKNRILNIVWYPGTVLWYRDG